MSAEPAPPIPPLRDWPRWLLGLSAFGGVLLVGVLDYLTGHEILLSSFYLVPVALAAWTLGRAWAVPVAVLSVGAWIVGDYAAGATYPQAFVPLWNAAIILAFYLVVIGLLTRLREMQVDLEERVQQRTLALTEEIAERERLERAVLDVGESERRRIGRDLHDSLGQFLTGTALAGQVLREKLAARSVPEAADAARLVSLVEDAIEVSRKFARGLDPVELEGGGLAEGLRQLALRTATLAPMACDVVTAGQSSVTDTVTATHLYRIAQEAITNAIKHGHARRVELLLEADESRVRLTVRDDGCGFAGPARRDEGMGLRVMAHRAAVMGGTFQVRSVPGAGTTVTAELPNS